MYGNAVCFFQSIAVEGYETGEHAPGLKLKGIGAYKAAHHLIKVGLKKSWFLSVSCLDPVRKFCFKI